MTCHFTAFISVFQFDLDEPVTQVCERLFGRGKRYRSERSLKGNAFALARSGVVRGIMMIPSAADKNRPGSGIVK